MRLIIFACLSILMLCTANQNGEFPGLKLRINSMGLHEVKNVAVDFLEEQIGNLELPDFSGDGSIGYEVTTLNIESFSLGSTSFRTSPPNIFTPSLSGARATLSADFRAWKKIRVFSIPFTVRLSGRIVASASGVNIDQDLELGRNENDQPVFDATVCSGSIGDFEASVQNTGIDWLVNILLRIFHVRLRNILQDMLCPSVVSLLQKQTSRITREFNVDFSFVFGTNINLGLVCAPELTSDGIMASLRGRCFPEDQPNILFPFNTIETPALSESQQMASLSISEYTLNTLLYSMWTGGFLMKTYSPDELNEMLEFNVTAATFTPFIPVFQNYGDSLLQLVVETPVAPLAEVNPGEVFMSGSFAVAVDAVSDDGSVTRALYIDVEANLTAEVAIENEIASLMVTNISAVAIRTQGFPVEHINQLIDHFLPSTILPAINEWAASGFMIPEDFDFGLAQTTLSIKQDALEIETDFRQKSMTTETPTVEPFETEVFPSTFARPRGSKRNNIIP